MQSTAKAECIRELHVTKVKCSGEEAAAPAQLLLEFPPSSWRSFCRSLQAPKGPKPPPRWRQLRRQEQGRQTEAPGVFIQPLVGCPGLKTLPSAQQRNRNFHFRVYLATAEYWASVGPNPVVTNIVLLWAKLGGKEGRKSAVLSSGHLQTFHSCSIPLQTDKPSSLGSGILLTF